MLELYSILEKSSLPKEITSGLLELLDGKAATHAAGVTQLQVKPRRCDNLHKYLTLAEIQSLETSDMWAGTAVLAA